MEFGRDVGADDVFYADTCGFFFALLTIGALDSMSRVLQIEHTSSNCAICRLDCFAMAVSFCCTIRSLLMDSLSCTLIFPCRMFSMINFVAFLGKVYNYSR